MNTVDLLDGKFSISGSHVVAEVFDADAIVLDVARGIYFSFSDSASIVWQAICSGSRPRDLLVVDGRFDESGLRAFLERLLTENLVVVTEATEGLAGPPPSDIVGRLAGATEALELFAFNDLADLFLADPVHDTDAQAGWPVLQKAL